MKIKCFVVVGDSKMAVAPAVEKVINGFIEANPKANVAGVMVNPDLSTTAGKAFVAITYEGSLSVLEAPAAPAVPALAVPPASADPASTAPAADAETKE